MALERTRSLLDRLLSINEMDGSGMSGEKMGIAVKLQELIVAAKERHSETKSACQDTWHRQRL